MHASQDLPDDGLEDGLLDRRMDGLDAETAAATADGQDAASGHGPEGSFDHDGPEPSADRITLRPLQLVSSASRNPVEEAAQAGPRESDPSLLAANRLLERELAEVDEEVAALQELLEEIPSIFERKFQQRLDRVLEEQRQLETENRQLWSRLRALAPGAEITLQPPRGLLPPSSGGLALKLEHQAQAEPELMALEIDTTASQT